MLKRIKIKNYKSLVDVEVELQPLSVLIGPNAAGKSNFLDAIQLLSRMVNSRTLKDAFEPPYRGKPLESFTFGKTGLDSLHEKESVSFSIEVDVDLSPNVIETVNKQIREMRKTKTEDGENDDETKISVREKFLRYRIEVEILPKSGFLRVTDEELSALNAQGKVKSRKAFLEKVDKQLHLRMEGQAHPTYHDLYLDHSILSLPLYPPHYPHLSAFKQELSRYFFFYFEPRERMRKLNPVKEVRHIGSMGEDLASFLNTLKSTNVKQFNSVEKALHLVIPSITKIDVEVNKQGEVDLWIKEGEMLISARVVSEGTLRVLGLLALSGASDPPALIGFEEPENGIHPRRLRMIADLLKTRTSQGDTQIIATTHSPALIDMFQNRNLLWCRNTNSQTIVSQFESFGLQADRNKDISKALSDEELPTSERIMRGDFDD